MSDATLILIDVVPDAESQTPPAAPGSSIDILARTLWGEARGEPVRGIEALAALVMNRVRRAERRGGDYWWGHSIQSVCLKPWQFACWTPATANRTKLEKVTEKDRRFRVCLRVARRAAAGVLDDPTHGATHYHARSLLPPWARGRTPCAEIGAHLFYNDVE